MKSLIYCCIACLLSLASFAAPASDLRLVNAVKAQKKPVVRTLLKQRVNVNAAQPDGATALAWAAHWDDLETADLLIRAGADVNAANKNGVTPLSLACTNGSAAMIQRLLDAGADPNKALATGETPLMTAASTGHVDAVRVLLAKGEDVNARETRGGQTALMWAVAEKHPDVVQVLVEHGADVSARSNGGFTPLLFAAQQGDVDSAAILLAAGADVNQASTAVEINRGAFTPAGYMRIIESNGSRSPLLLAIISGQDAVGRLLLEHGADPNVADVNGSVLHYAVRKGIVYINRLDSNGMGDSPTSRLPNMIGLVKDLLAHGANPNVRLARNPESGSLVDPVGASPLLLAAASADIELVRLLLANGADPMLATNKGTTALMVAAGVGRSEDRPTDEDRSALEVVKLLVELGSDVNAANQDDRQTALHGASRIGANAIIEFLATKGAKLDVMDGMGQTPLSLASGIITKGTLNVSKAPFGPHPSTAVLLTKLGAATLEASGVQVMDVVRDSARAITAPQKLE